MRLGETGHHTNVRAEAVCGRGLNCLAQPALSANAAGYLYISNVLIFCKQMHSSNDASHTFSEYGMQNGAELMPSLTTEQRVLCKTRNFPGIFSCQKCRLFTSVTIFT